MGILAERKRAMIQNKEYRGDLWPPEVANVMIREFITDTEAERDAEVTRLEADGWLAWLVGHQADTNKPAAVMYLLGTKKKGCLEWMESGKALSWDELANIYDKEHAGRPARTLPMDVVFNWVESQRDRFYTDPEKGTIHKIVQPR